MAWISSQNRFSAGTKKRKGIMKKITLAIALVGVSVGSAKAGFSNGNADPGAFKSNYGQLVTLYDDSFDALLPTILISIPHAGDSVPSQHGVQVVAVVDNPQSENDVLFRHSLGVQPMIQGWEILAEHNGVTSPLGIAQDPSRWSDLVHFYTDNTG